MGGMTHQFHIHGTQFKIISVDGIEPPKNEQGERYCSYTTRRKNKIGC
jgi:FtsP/CotA-like multicopper oxidase with cupredoxin domain